MNPLQARTVARFKKYRINLVLYLDSEIYSEPTGWDFNRMFGFNSIFQDGAKFCKVEVQEMPRVLKLPDVEE